MVMNTVQSWIYPGTKRKTYVRGWGGGRRGATCVLNLNFKYGCFAFWGVGHVPVSTCSTGHGHCSTYTCVNCVQYGGFRWKVDAKNSCVNFYASFYTQTFYTQIWVYFQCNSKCGWCKLETNIVEKRLFVVKKKTTYCTVSLTMIVLWSRTSCFIINDFLGCWLKCYFTCKLGCMFLATTVVLK